MERPSRSKKPVNYSDSQDFDDDEDFTCVKAPPSKKARTSGKEPERETTKKPASRTTSQEAGTQSTNRKERLSLDEKLYERDLEAALTLSMLKAPKAVEELSSSDEGGKDRPLSKSEVIPSSLLLSNCSVDVSLLGLDKITGECGSRSAPSRPRQAVSKAAEGQKPQQERDCGEDEDYQPTCTPDSESDADFSREDGSDDEEFTVKKTERKKPKKEKSARPAALKKDKKPSKPHKSGLEAAASPMSRSPSGVSITKKSASSPPVSRTAVSLSPAGGRLPKWIPPAQIGRSPSAPQSIQVKSPGQGLRLGLSRLARVKPLHPSAAGQ